MKSNSGFTLIELMVTIAIMSILVGISVYSFLNGLPDRRVRSASRDLYAGIQEARSEAAKRGENITITFDTSADSYSVTDTNGNQIGSHTFPDHIDLYEVTNDTSYTFNYRGMGEDGRVRIKYYRSGPKKMGVRVTRAGGISLIDETDSNW